MKLTVDTKLIVKAQCMAGAKVHQISEIIQAIIFTERCLKDSKDEKEKIECQKIIDRNEIKLRIFIATGNIG